MNGIYIIIGGNIGDRAGYLATCREYMQENLGKIIMASPIYETEAWGKTNQSAFLNQVLEISSTLPPANLLRKCLWIEEKMGRFRVEKWGERIIDIDILLYGNQVIREPKLTIPHPYLQERRFVLKPLTDIAPELLHPVFQLSLETLLNQCQDPLEVKLYTDLNTSQNNSPFLHESV